MKHTKSLVLTGLMTSIICILGPITIVLPFSPVPVSLCSFGILLSIYLLGQRYGMLSCLLYLLLGLVGLPVFSGFTGGIGKLLGPTGGYLIGYLLLTYISGLFFHKFHTLPAHFLGMVLGTFACYLLGTIWLSLQTGISFPAAFTAGVLPFLLIDFAKIFFLLFLGKLLKQRLQNTGLLEK